MYRSMKNIYRYVSPHNAKIHGVEKHIIQDLVKGFVTSIGEEQEFQGKTATQSIASRSRFVFSLQQSTGDQIIADTVYTLWKRPIFDYVIETMEEPAGRKIL